MAEWAEAIVSRLKFFGQAVPAEAPALLPCLQACLDQLEQAGAAVRLVNDMASVDDAMPLAAWRLALSR